MYSIFHPELIPRHNWLYERKKRTINKNGEIPLTPCSCYKLTACGQTRGKNPE